MKLRVLLVDDHELVRSGLRRAFERADDFEVAGEAESIADAIPKAAALRPDVVTVDIRLPDGDGLDLVRTLRTTNPDLGLVVLTMYPGDDLLFAALDAGANAFVAKSARVTDVVAAARLAAGDPTAFHASDLAAAMRRRNNAALPELSKRETQVLQLLAEGYSVAQVSRRLSISDSTTKTHIARLYDKLGAGNRAQALMTAIRLGLLPNASEGHPNG